MYMYTHDVMVLHKHSTQLKHSPLRVRRVLVVVMLVLLLRLVLAMMVRVQL